MTTKEPTNINETKEQLLQYTYCGLIPIIWLHMNLLQTVILRIYSGLRP